MKPFDLSAAVAGAPVQTRDGRPVTQLVKFDCYNTAPLRGVTNKVIRAWDEKGLSDCGDILDLFMATVKKTGWVARYAHDDGTTYINTTIFKDKATCVDICGDALSYHEITWEE